MGSKSLKIKGFKVQGKQDSFAFASRVFISFSLVSLISLSSFAEASSCKEFLTEVLSKSELLSEKQWLKKYKSKFNDTESAEVLRERLKELEAELEKAEQPKTLLESLKDILFRAKAKDKKKDKENSDYISSDGKIKNLELESDFLEFATENRLNPETMRLHKAKYTTLFFKGEKDYYFLKGLTGKLARSYRLELKGSPYSGALRADLLKAAKVMKTDKDMVGFTTWIRGLDLPTRLPENATTLELFFWLQARYAQKNIHPSFFLRAYQKTSKTAFFTVSTIGGAMIATLVVGPGGDMMRALVDPIISPLNQEINRWSYANIPYQQEWLDWLSKKDKVAKMDSDDLHLTKELIDILTFDDSGQLNPKFTEQYLNAVQGGYSGIWVAMKGTMSHYARSSRADGFALQQRLLVIVNHAVSLGASIEMLKSNMEIKIELGMADKDKRHIEEMKARIAELEKEMGHAVVIWSVMVEAYPEMFEVEDPYLNLRKLSRFLGHARYVRQYRASVENAVKEYQSEIN